MDALQKHILELLLTWIDVYDNIMDYSQEGQRPPLGGPGNVYAMSKGFRTILLRYNSSGDGSRFLENMGLHIHQLNGDFMLYRNF
jgi:hypothetical protein